MSHEAWIKAVDEGRGILWMHDGLRLRAMCWILSTRVASVMGRTVVAVMEAVEVMDHG
jgi:hypothetical protein